MQLKDILPSFVVAAISSIIVYAVSYMPLSSYIILPLQLAIGLMVLAALNEMFKIEEYKEIKKIFQSAITKIRNGK